jgi:CRISPR-associated protein Csm5
MSFLKNYTLRLKTLSPLFIGSGQELTKRELYFSSSNDMVAIPKFKKFFDLLQNKKLEKSFENSMLKDGTFNNFCTNQQLNINDFSLYELSINSEPGKEVLPMGIKAFIKDSFGNPYIPGSSVKGVLRTVLLAADILQSPRIEELRKDVERDINSAIRTRNPKDNLKKISEKLESCFFSILNIKGKDGKAIPDEIKDVLRGLRIADSNPISKKYLTACMKIDVSRTGNKASINILRECLKPCVTVELPVSIDTQIFGCPAEKVVAKLQNAIDFFYKSYCEHFINKFSAFNGLRNGETNIYLGGGAGYATKTIIYSLFGENAYKFAADILQVTTSKHEHKLTDNCIGISPRVAKATYYKGKLYEMGACKIEFDGQK